MKVTTSSNFFVLLLLLLFRHIHYVIAGSDLAHGAERAQEYLAYLAEEEIDPGDGKTRQYTISPGCIGSRPGGRCTLAEFLIYNWKGNTKLTPTGYSIWPSIATDPTTMDIQDLTQKLVAARFDIATKKGAHFKPISNIEPKKILPTLKLDYFGVLGNVGSRFSQLKESRGKSLTEYQSRIVSRGEEAARSVYELRYEDNEKFKIAALSKALPFKVHTTPYTIGLFGRTFNRIDAVETAKNAPSGAVADLALAGKNWIETDEKAPSHAKAILNARVGALIATCSRRFKL